MKLHSSNLCFRKLQRLMCVLYVWKPGHLALAVEEGHSLLVRGGHFSAAFDKATGSLSSLS